MTGWAINVRPDVGNVGPMSGSAGAAEQADALLAAGRVLLYPGLAMTSLLLLRSPADIPVGDILMAGAGILAALSLVRCRQRLPGTLVVAGALVAGGALLASTVSSEPLESLGIGARVVYLVLVVPWILLTLLTEQRYLLRAVLWWVSGAALCATFALLYALLGDVVPEVTVTGDNRITGFTAHVSDLGGITATAAGAGLGAVCSSLRRSHRALFMALLAVCATGLLLSGSVSGMLAVVAALAYLMLYRAVRLSRAAVLLLFGTIAGLSALFLLAGVGARDPIERFLLVTGQTSADSNSNTGGIRLDLAQRAVSGIVDHPVVGHGLLVSDNLLIRTFNVHNNFLGAWHAGGVLFLAGVLVATLLAARYCLARRPVDPLGTTVGASVVAAIVFAQTAPSFYNRYYWVPIAFAIVLAVRARAAASSSADEPARDRPA